MNLLEILLGQVPEAIYFALFMIFSKRLDRRRGLLITLMTIEYILLLNVFPFSIWSHILYFVVSYMLLKMLYKEKVQITDIFTLGIASFGIIIFAIIAYIICLPFTINVIVGNIIQKIIMFFCLYIMRNKLFKIQNMYKIFWNRNDKIPKPIKSVTFRCINLILFNVMFFIIHSYIIIYIIRRR